MLFLVCQMGRERYAVEASRIVEVVPLVSLKRLPQAPKGVAGVFNYRGQPVPAIDLCELTLGHKAAERLSTRIILVNYPDASGQNHLLGLIAEYATELLRKETIAVLMSLGLSRLSRATGQQSVPSNLAGAPSSSTSASAKSW